MDCYRCLIQWGKILGDTVNLKIINFPVSFNECFGGLALFNGDPVAAAEYATITDITNTNFKIYMYANNAGTGYANANIFYLFLGAQPQWGFSVTLSFESQLYYQHYPISFTVGPFTNILTTVSDEVNGVVYAPTTVNWYKDKFGIVCDYYSNGAYVKPTSVTFISLGI